MRDSVARPAARKRNCRNGTATLRTAAGSAAAAMPGIADVVLLVDTFNTLFRAGKCARRARGAARRPAIGCICRGPRTTAARCAAAARFSRPAWSTRRSAEARRMLEALRRTSSAACRSSGWSRRACSALRDEFLSMLPGAEAADARAERAPVRGVPRARSRRPGASSSNSKPLPQKQALLHGHCHQKAFAAMPAVERVLKLVPGLAGRDHRIELLRHGRQLRLRGRALRVSMQMAELSLLPAVRAARHGHADRRRRHELPPPDPRRRAREAVHVARVLARRLT